jgi:protein associated with RNAse G/E
VTEAGAEIWVESLKYGGFLHRRWRARLEVFENPLLILEGVFEDEVRHPLLGHIVAGTRSTEYFWTDRWYNVFRFREPTGELRCFYCNVNMPPQLSEGRLTFVDLDVDILVAPDFSYRVLDEDEFEENREKYGYPEEFRARAARARGELISLIDGREFPFDLK